MKTKERLAAALIKAKCPEWMIEAAKKGLYDDYESDLAAPIVTLVADLRGQGFDDLAKRAMDGEFDATFEEGEEWFATEGKQLIPKEMWHMFGYTQKRRDKPTGFGN